MSFKMSPGLFVCLPAALFLALPLFAQADRGNAELSVPGGKIVVNYGRPQLKGRDPLTWQKEGSYWRMGMNDMTTLSTPVSLVFNNARIPKGTYGIWLLKVSANQYELVFNSENSGMGMLHDKTKDIASVPMKKEAVAAPVEAFTIELKGAPQGMTFAMTWGTTRLSTELQFGK